MLAHDRQIKMHNEDELNDNALNIDLTQHGVPTMTISTPNTGT